MNDFKDIIADNEYFIDLPDCIADGNDYKETIENSFKITNGVLKLDNFSWSTNNERFEFDLIANGKPTKFSVAIMSDYVDNDGVIDGLNKILKESHYKGERKFCDIYGSTADFGVAFISIEKEFELAKEDLIWRDEGFFSEFVKLNNNESVKSIETDKSIEDLENAKPWWKFW